MNKFKFPEKQIYVQINQKSEPEIKMYKYVQKYRANIAYIKVTNQLTQ